MCPPYNVLRHRRLVSPADTASRERANGSHYRVAAIQRGSKQAWPRSCRFSLNSPRYLLTAEPTVRAYVIVAVLPSRIPAGFGMGQHYSGKQTDSRFAPERFAHVSRRERDHFVVQMFAGHDAPDQFGIFLRSSPESRRDRMVRSFRMTRRFAEPDLIEIVMGVDWFAVDHLDAV